MTFREWLNNEEQYPSKSLHDALQHAQGSLTYLRTQLGYIINGQRSPDQLSIMSHAANLERSLMHHPGIPEQDFKALRGTTSMIRQATNPEQQKQLAQQALDLVSIIEKQLPELGYSPRSTTDHIADMMQMRRGSSGPDARSITPEPVRVGRAANIGRRSFE